MKRFFLFTVNTVITIVFGIACSDSNNGEDIITREKYPLMDFAVKVGNSYYHGKINQDSRRVEIGTIENANNIVDVTYKLVSDGATIAPDPSKFIGAWKKEQTVTVTTEDQASVTYTIVLNKFVDQDKDVIFKDEFNIDGQPDPTKWILCKKGSSDWNDEMSESYDQAYVKDGNLVLVAEKVGDVYKAGGIESSSKFSFTFGKVEVRARITKYPNGAFPAVWMMPQKYIYPGWPNCGEIDIMEHIKQESSIHQTIHTNYTYNLKITNPPNTKTVQCNYADYNIYGMEWTEDTLTFSVNGQTTFTYPNLKLVDEAEKMQWPFTKDSAFYLILNMGLGGNKAGSWAGPIDDKNLPAILEVDWIKVSKLNK